VTAGDGAGRAKGRNNWKLATFAAANDLGHPVGVNFFQAEWDDHVPKLYATFKD
jgi:hypothetical protein